MLRYAVETRNMHTAIHELYIVDTAQEALAIMRIMETASTEGWDDQLFYDLGLFTFDHTEINFRFIDQDVRTYDSQYGKVRIVNEHCIDVY